MNLITECIKGNLENVKYIVEKGSDISIYDFSPLKWAVEYGYLEIVKYLVEQGVDISVHNYFSLRWAAQRSHLEVVNYFRRVLGDKIPCHECLVRSACLNICF